MAYAPPVQKDGKYPDWQWLDEARLEATKDKKIEGLSRGSDGGPQPSAPSN